MESKTKTTLFTIGYKKSNLQKKYIYKKSKYQFLFDITFGTSRSNAYGKTLPKKCV